MVKLLLGGLGLALCGLAFATMFSGPLLPLSPNYQAARHLDLVRAAFLGFICGLFTMAFLITFRKFRPFVNKLPICADIVKD